MDLKDIPVRVIGPGSQPDAATDGPAYIDMPSDMDRYDAPPIPEPDDVLHLQLAREAMEWLQAALLAFEDQPENASANLNALDRENRQLVNQILGEGENAVTFSGELSANVQESVLAGVWRGLYFDDNDDVVVDMLEVGAVPQLMLAPPDAARAVDATPDARSREFPNAMPILIELADRAALHVETGDKHSINLTLLPLSLEELEYLDQRLGRGPVDILSRAYGKCQVISTLTPNVWWVRYYNSMGTLILNTLEICDVPDVVAAAPEDIRDSGVRLAEMLAPYWTDT